MSQPLRQSTRTLITIEGRTYESVEAMPPEVRARYEQAMSMLADRDGNGVPDILEGDAPDPNVISHVSTTERVVVNGREYGSWDEVPTELRRLMGGRGGGINFRLGDAGAARGKSFSITGGALVALLIFAAFIGGVIFWIATL